ncbi:50S ribosomal protein L2 [Candidatus Cytomitobacter indipagum]|uniref:Large ribosomal subunit protein uL2 n=1 Tax=Candidatus Cytomitobacter indipagum TaxID=2601575 RepID=A0A5C0UG80_9PROT|nr:50S ribosomal protein L2 [Candidatus Cytomitobacter indipagum]QEK38282.1 50S ribosomal protein L2 [Candidatus Cytomitobacter indipagum]
MNNIASQVSSQEVVLKRLSPSTPGQRGAVLIDKRCLWKGKPWKALVKGSARKGGRNSSGKLTVRYKGGGSKFIGRQVSFNDRSIWNQTGTIERFEYDPGRTAFISLVDFNGEKKYLLSTNGLKQGDKIEIGDSAPIAPGNSTMLKNVPTGVQVHSVELVPGRGGCISRSAGSHSSVLGREGEYVILKLTSGEKRKFLGDCKCFIGSVSNPDHKNVKIGKAGRNRWKGIKPHVRGVAMNPVDHPHGGGEGKTSGGRHPCSPWGLATKGKRTRSKRKTNKLIIRRRNG